MAILARWLAPEEFGVVALVVATTAFLQVFADMGVGNAIIHHREITQNQLSSLYWASIGASVLIALLLVASAAWVADLYSQQIIESLLYFSALTLVLGSVGLQLRVMAQKNLRFRDLAQVELCAALAGFAAAVTVGALGGGAYALVAGSLVVTGTTSALGWLWLAEGWRPNLRLRLAEIRQFLGFGAYVIGNNIVSTLNLQADVLVGGRILGAQSIGLYSVSKDLSLRVAGVFNPAITQVGMPVMAKSREDTLLLKRIYLQTLRMTASVNFPFYAALAVFAQEIVSLLLGDKWQAAAGLLRVLACWGLLRSVGNPVGSLLMAQGRADLSFKWNVVWLAATLPAVWIGSQFGVAGLAWATTSLVALGYLPNWYFLVRPLCGAGFLEYSSQVGVPLVLALVSAIAGSVAALSFADPIWRLSAGVLLGGLAYCALSWFFNRVWVDALAELMFGERG